MIETTSLRINEIQIGERLRRSLDRAAVDRMKESIRKIGLQTPISVQLISEEEGYFLVAGMHRLQACTELGWEKIPVREWDGTELEARMWEIAENLHRAELNEMEQAEHVSEWIKLADERESSLSQSATMKSRRADGKGGVIGDGIRAAARELGIDKDAAHRAVKIASLPETAKLVAREVGLDDNKTALLTAAKADNPADELRRIAAEKAEKAAEKQAKKEENAEAKKAEKSEPKQKDANKVTAAAAKARDARLDKVIQLINALPPEEFEYIRNWCNTHYDEIMEAA